MRQKFTVKNTARRAAALVLAACLFVCCAGDAAVRGHAASADSSSSGNTDTLGDLVDELDGQITEAEEDLEEAEAQKEEAAEKQAALEEEVNTLKAQLQTLGEEIQTREAAVEDLEEKINNSETLVAELEGRIEVEHSLLKQRMAALQEMRGAGSIRLLSGFINMRQLLNYWEMASSLTGATLDILDQMQQEKSDLENADTVLAEQLEQYSEELDALQDQQAEQTDTLRALAKALQEADSDLTEAESLEQAAQSAVDAAEARYELAKDSLDKANEALIENADGMEATWQVSGSFIAPIRNYTYISTYFKRSHQAIDFSAPAGTNLYAVESGVVLAAGWNDGGYGYYVLIYHGETMDGHTYTSLYGHMLQEPSVVVGQVVEQGDLIGYVGNTGRSYGASGGYHLHFELWQDATEENGVTNKATRVDPLLYIF